MTVNGTPTNGDAPAQGWQVRLREYRCRGCSKLLFRGIVAQGTILEVKCHRCARVTTVGVLVAVTPGSGAV